MFKLPITYLGFDGKEKSRDFYFNLTKGEIAEINFMIPGGLEGFINSLTEDPNVKYIIDTFKLLILKSYGKRTPDGKFIKSNELSEEFAATDAYSELFIKFINDEDDFVNKFLEGILNAPAGSVQKAIAENPEIKKTVEELPSTFSDEF